MTHHEVRSLLQLFTRALHRQFDRIELIDGILSRRFEAQQRKDKNIPVDTALEQGFPTCGTRTTSGTRRGPRWYAGCLQNFFFITENRCKKSDRYGKNVISTCNGETLN